ncbi:hypothetical protein [Methylovirgula sp. HY1]|uniref:hypothetical protein n=1 Tax=Methylovirgula sp. HY1 TaxID=2822761 RepID=UPI001C5AB227|nr:hypothetical protein [Methylovirgula sp. HY1]QXX73627.1 hypothetical protein MHY1_00424 [Methylovirgula sp. HY1]
MDILRLALLSLAAGIAIILGASLLFQADLTHNKVSPATATQDQTTTPAQLRAARTKIEARIAAASPDYMRFFSRLRQLLPHEYDVILDGFARQSLEGADMTNVDSLLSEAVRALRLSSGAMAAKADGRALSRIFDLQLAMMRALAAKDPRLCVDFLYGGASPAFFDFSSENRPLVANMAIAGLDAINNGRLLRIERAPPSDKDFELLEQALKAKDLNQTEIAAILDGKTPSPPIASERMCHVGEIYLETLASLPETVRFRIYGLAVELMARS